MAYTSGRANEGNRQGHYLSRWQGKGNLKFFIKPLSVCSTQLVYFVIAAKKRALYRLIVKWAKIATYRDKTTRSEANSSEKVETPEMSF